MIDVHRLAAPEPFAGAVGLRLVPRQPLGAAALTAALTRSVRRYPLALEHEPARTDSSRSCRGKCEMAVEGAN